MIDPDPVFNDLSVMPLADSRQAARERLAGMIHVLVETTTHGLGKFLRTPENFHVLELANDYTVNDWLIDAKTDREQKNLLLQVAAKAPFFVDVDRTTLAEADRIEVQFDGAAEAAFLAALLLDVPVVSLHHDRWIAARFATCIVEIDDEGDLSERDAQQINLSCTDHYAEHAEWLVHRPSRNLRSAGDLWERRKQLFPDLEFCPNVESQVRGLSTGDKCFAIIVRRLNDMQRFSAAIARGEATFDKDGFDSTCRPTSQQTMTTFSSDYSFRRTDGSQQTCGWHLPLPNGERIYYHPCSPRFVVGHIGAHLPTKRDH